MMCMSNPPEYSKDTPDMRKFRSSGSGYYFDFKDAEKAVTNNWGDMSELGYYKYAVICKVGEGPMGCGDEVQWYQFVWNFDVAPREYDGVVIPAFVEAKKIDKPEMYERIFFATLG